MALLNQYVQVYGKLGGFFEKISQGQAPPRFTREFLRDIGFKSSNWVAAIALLKGLGFLSSDGTPTPSYMDLLDRTQWRRVLANAVKDAYSDIFVLKRVPEPSDLKMISGKYKSTYNTTDTVADRSARTFLALLDLCDRDTLLGEDAISIGSDPEVSNHSDEPTPQERENAPPLPARGAASRALYLSYNIQIHLPATKDIEVYNAIFKSLREHIID